MKKKNKKKKDFNSIKCPYCGHPAQLRSAEGIYAGKYANQMLYVCSQYPECDAYVNVHPGTRIPMGQLADKKLRELRRMAHEYFNALYENGYMDRNEAYDWLADRLQLRRGQTHIACFGEYMCEQTIRECSTYLANHSEVLRKEVRKHDGHKPEETGRRQYNSC